MVTSFENLLGIFMPNLEMLLIFAFATSLPTMFFLWIKFWLGRNNEENPEEVMDAQARADKAHRQDHGHPAAHGHDAEHHHHHQHHAHA